MPRTPMLLAAAFAAVAPAVHADEVQTIEWIFADPGTTFTGFIFPGDPRIGARVVSTRIFFDVLVYDGFDAADLDVDWTFPISPDPGNTPILGISGAAQGWSGAGTFHYFEETERFNGAIIQTLYGAATMGVDGELLKGARIEMDIVPVPGPAAATALGLAGIAVARRRRA